MRWAFPVFKSKLDRVSSTIQKLYLRPSADVSGRLTWIGQANLLTDPHSTRLVQAAPPPTRCKLDAASNACRSASRHDHFPSALDSGVRRVRRNRLPIALVNRPARMAGRAEIPGIS